MVDDYLRDNPGEFSPNTIGDAPEPIIRGGPPTRSRCWWQAGCAVRATDKPSDIRPPTRLPGRGRIWRSSSSDDYARMPPTEWPWEARVRVSGWLPAVRSSRVLTRSSARVDDLVTDE